MAQQQNLTSFVNQIIAAQQKSLSGQSPTRLAGDPNMYSSGAAAVDPGNTSPGIGSRIIDLTSRSLYTSASAAKEAVKIAQGQDTAVSPIDAIQKTLEAGGSGFIGQQKNTYRDVIDQAAPNAPEIVKGLGGLIGDVALDPLSYVPGAALKAAFRAPLTIGEVGKSIVTGTTKAGRIAAKAAEKTAADNALWEQTRLAQDTARNAPEAPIASVSEATTPAASAADASTQKIADAAVIANHAAPETVAALPVENIPRTPDVLDLTTVGQGKLGESLVNKHLPSLKDAVSKLDLFRPGTERAQALRGLVLPEWKASVEAAAAQGAKPTIFAADRTPYEISIPHALEALPENVTNDMMFGASWPKYTKNASLYPSQIARGMAESLRVDDLALPAMERYNQVYKAMRDAKPVGKGTRTIPVGQLAESSKALVDHVQTLRESQYETAKTLVKKDLNDAATITHDQSKRILDNLHDPAVPLSASFSDLAAVGPNTIRAGKEIGASANAASIAGSETAKLVAKVAPEADTSAARAASAVKRERIASGAKADSKVIIRVQNHLNTVAKEIDAGIGVPVVDLGTKAAMHLDGFMSNLLHPLRSKFSYGYGMGPLADVSREFGDRAAHTAQLYRQDLNKLAKTHGADNLNAAFSAYKRGEVPIEPAAKAAYDDMAQAVNFLFDTKDPLMGALWRTGAGVDEINKALKMKGITHAFDEAKAAESIKQPGALNKDKWSELADQWRTWDIADPLNFLDRAHQALSGVAAKLSVGTFVAHQFGKLHPGPGLVRITAKDKTILGPYIDTSKFYSRDAAESVTRLESMLHEATNFRGEKGATANFVNHLLDPVMQIWKPFMTIFRPGHHMRNLMGDVAISALDKVYNPAHYRKALSMMRAGGALHSEGITGLEKLTTGELAAAKGGHETMSTVRLQGRNIALSYDAGYRLAHRFGVLQSFHQTEDILEGASKLTDRVMSTAWMRGMGLVSEKTGQFTRLAHFNALMERKSFTRQFSSLEDAAQAASARVKQFHPDVKGLTPFEQKYMRRIFPFYNWTRQAFPVVMNALISHPGRVNLVPKAQYNAAVAMGVNPNTLSDPFPTNKLYPNFVTQRLTGPLFGDTGFNFGTPTEGILGDDLNGSPWRNLVGMVNPIIKDPIEMATQTNLSTGAKINAMGEYVDQQLPLVNQASTISGYSATGTVAALLQGKSLPVDERAVARGEKDHFFNTSLANFLTGVSAKHLNTQTNTNLAKQGR